MEWIADPASWVALLTLTSLEIVLGIDNIVFISILASKLPHGQQDRARQLGLAAALITRILLLLSLAWISRLETPLFTLPLVEQEVTGRDLVLLAGGLFLLWKSTREIHDRLEGVEGHASAKVPPSFGAVIAQIAILDIVFSIDSVITAVGMAREIAIMVAAVMIAIAIMLFASGPIARFVHRHPTVKMLALSFLLLIGMTLLVEALHVHIPKGYIYFAMGLSVFVEMLNLRSKARDPISLHEPYSTDKATEKAATD
jgi:predicted tellurium resistance membrane protein TerC